MSLKKAAFRALFWDFIGKVLRQGAGIIVGLLLMRLLEPADFGLIAMANVFIALSMIFIDFSLSAGLINKPQPTQEQYSSVFFLNMLMALLLAGLLLWAAPFIGMFYHDNTDVVSIVRVLAFGPLIQASCCVQRARLMKTLDFKSLALSNVTGAVVAGPCGVIAAFYGLGVWSLIIQHYITVLIGTLEIWRRSDWRPSFVFSIKSLRDLWRFGARIFFSEVLETFFSKLDILVIGKMFSPALLGYYNKAKSYNEFIINYVSSGLGSVFFPLFSQIQSDSERIRSVAQKALHCISFLSFGLMGLFYLVTEDLVIVLFSQKWTLSIPFYRIIILTAYASPVSSILMTVIKGRGRSEYFLRAEILKKVILTASFGGFFWGLKSYLWVMVGVCFIATVFINGYYFEKAIGYKRTRLFFCLAMYFIIAFICVMLGFWVYKVLPDIRIIRLLVGCLFFAVSYLGINKILKTKGWDALCEVVQHGVSVVPFTGPLVNGVGKALLYLFR